MQLIKKLVVCALFVTIGAIVTLGSALASITNPENGKEYTLLAQPQPTDSAGKVEVIEFFFYSCPHCNVLDPVLTAWVKKQGNAIAFKRVHVDFGQGTQLLQRMYYTLEAMGEIDRLHSLIFNAIHKEQQPFRNDQDVLAFLKKNGVDIAKYQETAKSFAIAAKMSRAQALQASYQVQDVPRLYIDGKYLTSPGQVMKATGKSDEAEAGRMLMTVLDALVLKAQKENKTKK